MDVKSQLQCNYGEIKEHFDAYVHAVDMSLKKNSIHIDESRAYLLSLPFIRRNQVIDENTRDETKLVINSTICDYEYYDCLVQEFDLHENCEEFKFAEHFKDYVKNHEIVDTSMTRTFKFDSLMIGCDQEHLMTAVCNALSLRPSEVRVIDNSAEEAISGN